MTAKTNTFLFLFVFTSLLITSTSNAKSCYDKLVVREKTTNPDDVWTKTNIDYKNTHIRSRSRSSRPDITNCEINHGFVVFWNSVEEAWYKMHQEHHEFKRLTSNFFERNEAHGYTAKLYPLRIELTDKEKAEKSFVIKYAHFRKGPVMWELVTKSHPHYYWLLGIASLGGSRPEYMGLESYSEYIGRLKYDVEYFGYKPDLREDLREHGFVVIKSLSESNTWYRLHQDHELFSSYTRGEFDDGFQNDLYPYKPDLSSEDQMLNAVVAHYPSLDLWEILRQGHPKYESANRELTNKLRLAGISRYDYNRGIVERPKYKSNIRMRAVQSVVSTMPAPSRPSNSRQLEHSPGANLNPLLRAHLFSSPNAKKEYEQMLVNAEKIYGYSSQEFEAKINNDFLVGFQNGYQQAVTKKRNAEIDRNREFWLLMQRSGYRTSDTRENQNGERKKLDKNDFAWVPEEKEPSSNTTTCYNGKGEVTFVVDWSKPKTGEGSRAICM